MPSKKIMGKLIDNTPVEMDVDKLIWRPATYALIFDAEGQILVLDNMFNGRKEFPGGGVEIDETFEQALLREVWEETGLSVEVIKFITMIEDFYLTLFSQSHWHTIKCFYQCRVIEGHLRSTLIEDELSVNPHWINPQTLTEDTLTIGWDALRLILNQNES